MRVAYVTMTFPAPSETFHSNDVRQVSASGAVVTVYALRGPHRMADRLAAERGLGRIRISHNEGPRTVARAVAVALRRPRMALGLIASIVRTCAVRPVHLAKSAYFFPRVLEVFDELLTLRPDVVHALWGHYPAMVLHLVQRHLPGVATSISFSVYDIRYRYPISGIVAHRATMVRSLSRVTAAETADAFGFDLDTIHVIHDSVDLGLLPAAPPRTPRRVLTAARLVKAKGVDLVIRSFARVRQTYPDATLRVLGDGPEKPRLVALAAELGVAESVHFAGHVSQTEVLDEMQRAAVFLFLSRTERLPNVVKEAMACGCVCVASRTIGIEELIVDGTSGFIIEQGDIDTAAERVTAVFDGRIARDRLTRAAADHIRERFDLRTNAERYLSAWRRNPSHQQRDPASP